MKKLQVNTNPPIRAYLSYAHILSSIHIDGTTNDWFYSNFISLYSVDGTDDIWKVLQCLPDTYTLLHDQYIYRVFHINQEIVDFDEDIINNLKRWIDKEYYVIYYLDEFHLQGARAFKKAHQPHAQLFYGYNDEKKEFHILNFAENNNYEPITISYDDVMTALITEEMIQEYDWTVLKYQNPRLLKKNDNTEDCFDISIILDQLRDYLNSTSSYMNYLSNCDLNWLANRNKILWGVDVYDNLISYKLKSKEKTEYEPFHLLWEHKQVMVSRFEYLEKKLGIEVPDRIFKSLKELVNKAQNIRFSIMKDNMRKTNCEENKIISLLEEIKQLEIVTLGDAINFLESELKLTQ